MPHVTARAPSTDEDAPAVDSEAASGWYASNERLLLPAATFVGIFLLWEVGARSGWLHPIFFSSPTDVVLAGIEEVQVPRFWNDVWVSSFEFTVGYVAALITGVLLGLVTGWYRRLAYFFDPWLAAFSSLPRVALLPLVVLYLGWAFGRRSAWCSSASFSQSP
jgi:ABC-type nitrate/sulfonate/bicarbonate transport system permease component